MIAVKPSRPVPPNLHMCGQQRSLALVYANLQLSNQKVRQRYQHGTSEPGECRPHNDLRSINILVLAVSRRVILTNMLIRSDVGNIVIFGIQNLSQKFLAHD